jgi:hypothetical protein
MYLMEILKVKDEGRLSSPDYSEPDLQGMIRDCEPQQGGQMGLQATQAIQAIRDEINRRRATAERQAEARRHQESVALDRESLKTLAEGQKRLKESVDRLSKPHCLIWWTFLVALLTLIVCVIGYWDQIVRLIRAL